MAPHKSIPKIKTFKIVVIGPPGCGKTQFIRRVAGKTFDPLIPATNGLEITTVKTVINGEKVIVNFWETSENSNQYFADADGILFMFDLDPMTVYRNLVFDDVVLFPRQSFNFMQVLCKADNHFYNIGKENDDHQGCGYYHRCCSAKNTKPDRNLPKLKTCKDASGWEDSCRFESCDFIIQELMMYTILKDYASPNIVSNTSFVRSFDIGIIDIARII